MLTLIDAYRTVFKEKDRARQLEAKMQEGNC
jgi:hypothetical protein